MERIKKEDLEKMYGKLVDEKDLSIIGFDGKMHFEIYDGFAYCSDFKGDEYCIKYPKLEFIEDSVEMQENIRKEIGLKDDDKISILDVIPVYNEMTKNGVRIMYNEETNSYVEKPLYNAIPLIK